MKFEFFDLSHIPRSGNTHADSLATLATSSAQNFPRVIMVEDLCTPTLTRKDLLRIHQINLGPSWIDPILLFLKRDILPKEKAEAEKIQRKAPRFWLSEDKKLYKLSFSGPYLFCVYPGPLLKDTGGQACRKKHKSMLENVISVRDSCQTFTSLEESLILYPAFSLLLNEAWIS